MDALGKGLRWVVEASGRLWRRSKLQWLFVAGVVALVCCVCFGMVVFAIPVRKQGATAPAVARELQGTVQPIVTEGAEVATETVVAGNVAATVVPSVTPAPSETPAPAEVPAPLATDAPTETPTIFYVVVTGVPTETAVVVATNTRVVAATGVPVAGAGGEVVIVDIHPKGTGSKQPDEYAEFRNVSGAAVNLSGWRFNAGSEGQDFSFASGFVMETGKSCRIYTNEIHADWCGLSFGWDGPIWNNDGDCGHLYNAEGVEMSKRCYGNKK